VIMTVVPASVGVAGYIAPLIMITVGYALFQAANNTAVMTSAGPDRVGVVSGMLGLSRNLGLITGVSVMGAVFAQATGATNILTAHPSAIATGMRITFLASAGLIGIALAVAWQARRTRAGSAT
jgi:hypothetical protein